MKQNRSAADREFARVTEEEWAWRNEQHLGAEAWVDAQLPAGLVDVSPEAQDARATRWRETLAAVDALPEDELSPDARTDREVYRHQLGTLLDAHEHRVFEAPCNSDQSFWQTGLEMGELYARRLEDADRYLQTLSELPRWFDQNTANMRAGIARGFAPPAVSMTGRDQPVQTIASASFADETPWLKPLAGRMGPAWDQRRAAATRLIEDAVIPAYRKLADFLTTDYLPALPTEIAAVPAHGEDYYAAQIRAFATMDLPAKQIHELGKQHVTAIEERMGDVAAQAGFGSAEEMRAFMRTDPQFYVTEPEQLLKEAAWHCKKFDALAHRFFGYLPRRRFAIIEPPPDIAPYYTYGRGGVGTYILNTYALDQRPLYSLPALTLHEAAPGHAFQIPFALEMDHLPDFRRLSYTSAYGEGWALYTEVLGEEMGLYETPFEVMGMLSYQMWRAVRMVVDPGIHALGWTREQAQRYLADHTAIGWHEVVTEIDRYISWPGQAVSYYLGKLVIEEGRLRAEQALGERFELPNFHDAVLSLGCVPLAVLERELDAFAASDGSSPLEGTW